MKPLAERAIEQNLMICAHRGASGMAPENTLAALQLAVDSGATMVELDVQVTRDNTLVVFHDDTLERTTNGQGALSDKTYEELYALDAGSWFSNEFIGEHIPRLQQVLDILAGKVYLNIEIKPMHANQEHARAIAAIVDLIDQYQMAPYTAFSSFDHSALVYIKSITSTLHTVALNIPGDDRLPSRVVSTCGADGYGCSIEELNAQRSENCHHHQIPLGVYTVNTPKELEYVLSLGVNGVVSNEPFVIAEHYKSISSIS